MHLSKALKAHDFCVNLGAVVVAILILAAVGLVSSDVAGRYFFAAPIGWVGEITEYILLCIPFLSMPWLVRRAEGHVRVDLLVNAVPAGARRYINLISSVIAAATCAFAGYLAVETTIDHFQRNVLSYGIYPFPKYISISVIAWGFILTAIEFVRKAIDDVK
jgi:TRAP-type C4-dicarboxylate transport system permease small subunit